jgi:phage terminase large subunit
MTETRKQVTLPFAPRPWQVPLVNDKAKRIVAVVHRRAGKSTALMWRGIRRCLVERRPLPRVVHILPYGVMWSRTGLWDALTQAVRDIPGAEVRKASMSIAFANGAVFQCGGADNPDSWRGGYADECIIDEFDDTPQTMVPLVIEPMLADRDGTLVRSGTPKGRGLLQTAYDRARVTVGYSTYLLDYTKTDALSIEAIARLREEMSEEEFEQELMCSFNAPNSGSYYGKILDQAERDGRICAVSHDPALKVWTAWDLGIDDATAIWCVQITRGGEWRLIDYIEDSGAGLDHYVRLLQQRPYVYERHLLPHDAEVRELGSGRSRTETLHSLGVRPTRTVRQHSVADGINAVRMVLPRAWFDAERCAKGIHALRHYRREWNEAAQTWRSAPVHDHASHGADAMRYLCLGVREVETKPIDSLIERQFPAERLYIEGRPSTSWMGI